MSGLFCYFDGAYIPQSEAKVSVDDRAFLFAAGLYEVTKSLPGPHLFGEAEHMKRLMRGLEALSISNATSDAFTKDLPTISRKLLAMNGLEQKEATIYVQVSQGVPGPRAHYFPPPETKPTLYVFAKPLAVYEESFFTAGVTATVVPDIRWGRCDLKTTCLLPNCMAKQKAKEHGAYECLLTRQDNGETFIVEASHSNVFAVIDGQLWTESLSKNVLPGITRNLIVDRATEDLGIAIVEKPIPVSRWSEVTELFTTSTGPDVAPIVSVLEVGQVGDGKVGPVTKRVIEAFRGKWLQADKATADERLAALGLKVDTAVVEAARAEHKA